MDVYCTYTTELLYDLYSIYTTIYHVYYIDHTLLKMSKPKIYDFEITNCTQFMILTKPKRRVKRKKRKKRKLII